jgi:hypothetical protein
MIGRVCPCHVANVAAGTGRVRVFLITSPEMPGNAWVAFNMQALLSSARMLAVARSATEATIAILMRIGPPDISRTGRTQCPFFPEDGNITEIVVFGYNPIVE